MDDEYEINVQKPPREYDLDDYTSVEWANGNFDLYYKKTHSEAFDDYYLVFDRISGIAIEGPSKEGAFVSFGRAIQRYKEQVNKGEREGKIVMTDSVLGGKPRVSGTRIGVNHILNRYRYSDSDTLAEIASSFVGTLTIDEVRMALNWAIENKGIMQELEEERDLFVEWLEEHHSNVEGQDGLLYVPPESEPEISFEEFKRKKD